MLLNQNNSIASIKTQKSTPYNAIRFALQYNRARVSPLSQRVIALHCNTCCIASMFVHRCYFSIKVRKKKFWLKNSRLG